MDPLALQPLAPELIFLYGLYPVLKNIHTRGDNLKIRNNILQSTESRKLGKARGVEPH